MIITIPGEWWDYIEERDDGEAIVSYVSKSKTPKDMLKDMMEADGEAFEIYRRRLFVFED
jgi:hypothetical protein